MRKSFLIPCLLLVPVCFWLIPNDRSAMSRGTVIDSDRHATDVSTRSGPTLPRQLEKYSGQFWARVAGRDTDLPPKINGHDEFAAQWTRDMKAALHGLPFGIVRQPFATPGFHDLPASRPGMNVALVVPGTRHPDQAVIVGSHYDGEPTSHGSAFDDASGCIIMLGLAHDLGTLWRTHGLPSRTVEFVLFDAEEQGLIGSTAFTFAYRQGAIMPRPVVMINEEQSGVGYPVRPFGLLRQRPTPSFALTTTEVPSRWAHLLGPLIAPDNGALARMDRHLRAAKREVFPRLHRVYPSLAYRGGKASSFTKADQKYFSIAASVLCCSDHEPFEALGLPTVTFTGNTDYYSRSARPWSFPYDQPDDILQALACDTGGSPQPSAAFEAALRLPQEMSRAIVNDYAPPARGKGMALFSTLSGAGTATHFQSVGSKPVTWSFGDGARATGTSATHTYARAGTYSVSVTSKTVTSWRIRVTQQTPIFKSPLMIRPPARRPWHPRELQDIAGCGQGLQARRS